MRVVLGVPVARNERREILPVSYIQTEPAREMLTVLSRDGPNMSSALLVFRATDGSINWRGSDDISLADALWMLEKVKTELLKRS